MAVAVPFDNVHRCPDCFEPREPAQRCPHCGFDPSTAIDGARYLAPFTLLGGRYRVGRILGQPGSYGVVYAGYDHSLHSGHIAIKEFLLSDSIADRARGHDTIQPRQGQETVYAEWRERFLSEARLLASLRGAGRVVRAHDLLDANNTAYLVMERLRGENLGDYLRSHGRLDPATARDLAEHLLDALEPLHARPQPVLHRDLSPNNLFLRERALTGLTLLDFGLARAGEPGPVRTASAGLGTPGFRAPEQLTQAGLSLGPWTDLYALGALLYLAVTGQAPVDAGARLAGAPQPPVRAARPDLPADLTGLIDACLHKAPEQRPAHVAAARALLAAATLAPGADLPPPAPVGPKPNPKSNPKPKPRWPVWLGAALLASALAVGGYQVLKIGGSDPEEQSHPLVAVEPAPAPTEPARTVPNPAPDPEQRRQNTIAALLAKLDAQLAARRYTVPDDDNALISVERLAELDPKHPAIAQTRRAMGDYYRGRVEEFLVAEQPDSAEDYLGRARRVQPEREDWTKLAERIAGLRETLEARRMAEEKRLAEEQRRQEPQNQKQHAQPPLTPDTGTTPGRFVKLDTGGRDLPASAQAWSCVRDSLTGLIWEVKTDDGGLRDKDHTYTWYDPNPQTNGGKSGTEGGGKCAADVRCDTTGYAEAVNRVGLCGARDWRLPTREELRSIADLGRYNPAIDTDWFPNSPSSGFWSASPNASATDYAWDVDFDNGSDFWNDRSSALRVRLVRAGQ